MSLRSSLSSVWHRFQWDPSPAPAEEIGPVLEGHKTRVRVLDLVEFECFVATCSDCWLSVRTGRSRAAPPSRMATRRPSRLSECLARSPAPRTKRRSRPSSCRRSTRSTARSFPRLACRASSRSTATFWTKAFARSCPPDPGRCVVGVRTGVLPGRDPHVPARQRDARHRACRYGSARQGHAPLFQPCAAAGLGGVAGFISGLRQGRKNPVLTQVPQHLAGQPAPSNAREIASPIRSAAAMTSRSPTWA